MSAGGLTDAALEDCIESRLRSYRLYDKAVDIVSIFELLYTVQGDLSPTVAHFERFPRVPHPDGTDEDLTPDFTVLFTDGTGLIGEISQIAQAEESVESLCGQLHNYGRIGQLPTAGGLHPVNGVDVMLLVEIKNGTHAFRRVFEERIDAEDHWYSPPIAPVLMQYGFDTDAYTVQHFPSPTNGVLNDYSRDEGLGGWIADSGGFTTGPRHFGEIKVARAFTNDPVDPLYLATHLWGRTFAAEAALSDSERPVPLIVEQAEVASKLRIEYGAHLRTGDVGRALDLLADAKLAQRVDNTTWRVAWEEIRESRGKDLARVLADRACRKPKSGAVDRLPKLAQQEKVTEPKLFED